MASGGIPDLVIPVRFDVSKIPGQLGSVGAAGKKAGEDTEKGFKKAQQGSQSFLTDLGGMTQALTQIAGLAKGAMQQMGQQFQEASQYTHKMAEDFAVLRAAMQQVAALTGKSNTNVFTLEQTQKAAAAKLKPEEWIKFQEQFQSYGGAYIEGDQSRFRERGGVSAAQQAEQYQQKLAEFAKARGLAPDEAAQLAGGLLQFSKGPQTVEGLTGRFGQVFKTLERAPTPVPELMPQMSRVMAMGASPEEAAQLLAIQSEANPHEEEVHVRAALKAINEQIMKGKGAALGQVEGQTPLEQVKAASAAIGARMKAGEKLMNIMAEVAPTEHERKGLTGFVTRGLSEAEGGAGGFARVAGYMKDTPKDFVDQANREFEKSDRGRDADRDARLAVTVAERGMRQQAKRELEKEADIAIASSGELERPEGFFGGMMTKAGQAAGQGTKEDQVRRAEVARQVQMGLEGYAEGRAWLGAAEPGAGGVGAVPRSELFKQGRGMSEELLTQAANELARLRTIAEEQRTKREALTVPPGQPANGARPGN
jgi:hypothetical protein